MIAASSSSGGAVSELSRPLGAELARRGLSGLVSGTSEGEHTPTLKAGDLGDDVRRGAKPVQTEPLGLAGHPRAR